MIELFYFYLDLSPPPFSLYISLKILMLEQYSAHTKGYSQKINC